MRIWRVQILLSIFALIWGSHASADAGLANAICKPPEERGTWPALWRMSDADTEMYLFGTVHIVPYCVKWKSPKVAALLKNADVVYRESTDTPDKGNEEKLAEFVTKLATPEPGNSLGAFLSDEHINGLAEISGSDRSKIAPLLELRPWITYLALLAKTNQINAQALSKEYQPPPAGSDSGTAAADKSKRSSGSSEDRMADLAKELEELADEFKRIAGFREVDTQFKAEEIRYLDSIEETLTLFSDPPDQDAGSAVRQMVCAHSNACVSGAVEQHEREKRNSQRIRLMGRIIQAWLAGDQEALLVPVKKMAEQETLIGAKALLADRNHKWVRILNQAMDSTKGTIIVAAGAGHFVGKESLLALLSAEGWKLKRVQ